MTRQFILLCLLAPMAAFGAPFSTTNLLSNPGAETGTLTNWIAGGVSNPRVDNGSFDLGINPHSGTYDFLAGTGANGSLSQTVALVGNQGITAGAIDAGTLFAYASFWEQGLNQGTPSDDAYVSLGFLDAVSNSISAWSSPVIDSHSGSWSNYSAYIAIPANTRFIQYTMNFVRNSGSDLDAFVDDNVLTVTSSFQRPVLNISVASANVLLFWPTLNADGFILEQNTNLAATNWTQVSNPMQTANGTNQVTVTSPTGDVFFRLHHP